MKEMKKKKADVEKKMLFLRNKRLAQPRIIRLRAPSYYTEKERAFVYDQNRKDTFYGRTRTEYFI